ncbi:MAG: competence protein ComEC family protein [Bacteroidia bacterium]|nr:competence protein ComEC family protein [Bacteroidia bacterium]
MPAWRYPFIWAAVGLITGILLSEAAFEVAIAGVVILAGISAYLWIRLKWGRLVWALPLFAFLGEIRAWSDRYPSSAGIERHIGQLVKLSGYIVEEPARTRKAYRLLLEVDSLYQYRVQSSCEVTGRLLLYTKDSSVMTLPIGTRVNAICRLDSLRYATTYWQRQGVFVSGFTEKVATLGIERSYWRGYFQRLRQKLIAGMNEVAPERDGALGVIQALLLGYKRGVDPEIQSAFQLSGTAHILAVSGMHVGLVLALWLFLLGKLPGGWSHHWISQSLLLGLIVLYGFLTGASPSAMRAVVMGGTAILARMLYQSYLPLNALGFAAFLQSVADPSVIYQIGFQLSYAAVGGIMAFYALARSALSRFFSEKMALFRYFKDLMAISIAAQAGTFFLSWAYFGRFPLYFLVANLLAVPLATAVAFTAVGWIVLMPIPLLGSFAGYAAYGVAWLLVKSVYLLSLLPGGSISLPPLSPVIAGGLTLLTLAFGGIWTQRKLTEAQQPWML